MALKYKDDDAGIEINMTVVGPDGQERELTQDMQRTVIDRVQARARASEHVFAKIRAQYGEKAEQAAKAVVSMLHYHYAVFRLFMQAGMPDAIIKQMLNAETKAESQLYRCTLEATIPDKVEALLVMRDCAALARADFDAANEAADTVESALEQSDASKDRSRSN